MKYLLDRLLEQPNGEFQSPGTVIHLGAGADAASIGYERLQPQELILVDADPQVVATLQRHFVQFPGCRVMETCVTADGTPAVFFRFNMRRLNGTHSLEGFRKVYPGLRILESFPVASEPIGSLLSRFDLPPGRQHLLIIDLPQIEEGLLEGIPQEFFEKITHVLLASQELPDGSSAQGLPSSLREIFAKGFFEPFLSHFEPNGYRGFLLRKNPSLELRAKLVAAEKEISDQKWFLGEKTAELEKALDERARLADVLAAQEEKLAAALEGLGTREHLISELSDRSTELQSLWEAAATKAQDLEEILAKLSLEIDAEKASRNASAAQLAELLKEREALKSQILAFHDLQKKEAIAREQLQKQTSELKDALTAQENKNAQFEKQTSELKDALTTQENKNAQLEKQTSELKDALTTQENKNAQLEKQTSELKDALTTQENKNAQLEKQTSELKDALTAQENKNAQLEKQTSELGKEREALKTRLSQVETESTNQQASLQEQIKGLEATKEGQAKEIQQLQSAIELRKQESIRLRAASREKESKIVELESELQTVRDQTKAIDAQVDKTEARLALLNEILSGSLKL